VRIQLSDVEGNHRRAVFWPIDRDLVDFCQFLCGDSRQHHNVLFNVRDAQRADVFHRSPETDDSWDVGSTRFKTGGRFEQLILTAAHPFDGAAAERSRTQLLRITQD